MSPLCMRRSVVAARTLTWVGCMATSLALTSLEGAVRSMTTAITAPQSNWSMRQELRSAAEGKQHWATFV